MAVLRRHPSHRCDGSVTAEAAVALPALVVFLGAIIWGIGVANMQSRCATAARSAALAAARGEPESVIAARVTAMLGPGSSVAVSRAGRAVSVHVRARAAALGVLPAAQVIATSYAELEPAGGP